MQTMRIKIDGIHLNYELAGQGRTLVLIHGLRSSLASWGPLIPPLAEYYQVLAWDVRGHGQSDKPDEEYTVSQWAQDLSLLLHKLAITKAYVLGISMGGVIAQRFALDYPGVVEALILASTSSEVGERATRAWEAQAEQLARESQGQPDELTKAGIRSIRAIARYLNTAWRLCYHAPQHPWLPACLPPVWPRHPFRAAPAFSSACFGLPEES